MDFTVNPFIHRHPLIRRTVGGPGCTQSDHPVPTEQLGLGNRSNYPSGWQPASHLNMEIEWIKFS
jgi:hypothetical protein